jgi:hypothetical protein
LSQLADHVIKPLVIDLVRTLVGSRELLDSDSPIRRAEPSGLADQYVVMFRDVEAGALVEARSAPNRLSNQISLGSKSSRAASASGDGQLAVGRLFSAFQMNLCGIGFDNCCSNGRRLARRLRM